MILEQHPRLKHFSSICVLRILTNCVLSTLFVFITLPEISETDAVQFEIEMERNKTVSSGSDVTFPCFTAKAHAVNWYVDRLENIAKVCDKGLIVHGQTDKFSLDVSGAGDFNLRLHNANVNDTAAYKCIEDDGFGPKMYVYHLAVDDEQSMMENWSTDSPETSTYSHPTNDAASNLLITVILVPACIIVALTLGISFIIYTRIHNRSSTASVRQTTKLETKSSSQLT